MLTWIMILAILFGLWTTISVIARTRRHRLFQEEYKKRPVFSERAYKMIRDELASMGGNDIEHQSRRRYTLIKSIILAPGVYRFSGIQVFKLAPLLFGNLKDKMYRLVGLDNLLVEDAKLITLQDEEKEADKMLSSGDSNESSLPE